MLIELVLNGLVQGSLLALICVGYSLAYGSAKVINFAHADVMIAGGGYLVLLWMGGTRVSDLILIGMALLFGRGKNTYIEGFGKIVQLQFVGV